MSPSKKYIIHIDGDNFFASCELTRFPHLRDKPVVVGRERGIAVAFNSHAKKLGIVRAMPIHHIQKEFPQVTILTSHFELYKIFSARIVQIANRYFDTVSVYSIDEVFCSYEASSGDTNREVLHLARSAQKDIYQKLGITVSIGISETKVLAKLATSAQKPNGITHITTENRRDMLSRIPVEDVWGIGGRTAGKWRRRGIHTARDFADIEEAVIQHEHTPVRELYYELRGISLMKVGGEGEDEHQKSFQSTESFPKSNERAFLFSEISRHTEILGARLHASGQELGSIHIYLKDEFRNYYSQGSAITSSSKVLRHISLSNDSMHIINTIETLFDTVYNPKYLYKSTGVTFVIAKSKKSKDTPNDKQASLFDGLNSLNGDTAELDISSLPNGVQEQNEPRVSTSLEALKASIRAKNGYSSIYTGSSSLSLHRKANKRRTLAETDRYIYGLPLPYLGTAK